MRKVLGATLLAVALTVGLAGAPAHAGRSTTVTDNPNDARAGIDMRLVTINKVQGALQIRTAFSHMGRNLNGMQYYFDTKRARLGPEFGAVFYRDKDGDHLTAVHVYRMTSWTKVGQELTCGTRSRWRINANGTGVFTARFNYGCLEMKGKNRVRAAVRTWDYTTYRGTQQMRRPVFGHNDLMRARRTFSPWI
jgi:hypothetical protein